MISGGPGKLRRVRGRARDALLTYGCSECTPIQQSSHLLRRSLVGPRRPSEHDQAAIRRVLAVLAPLR